MELKKNKGIWNIESLGGIAGVALIICVIMAFLDYENASVFFIMIIGLGSLINGILAYLKFRKKNYLLGVIMTAVTAALLLLVVMQIILLER